jgi:hypothetical protein
MAVAIDIGPVYSGVPYDPFEPTGTLMTFEKAGDFPSGVLKLNNWTYA